MPVEFVARENVARVEERLSLKLSIHMLVAGVVIGNAGYMGQQYQFEGHPFLFKNTDDVIVTYHEGSVELKVKVPDGAVKYVYDLRMRQCHRITIYGADGKEQEANADYVQSTYEKLVDYCAQAVIGQRVAYAQQVTTAKQEEPQQ